MNNQIIGDIRQFNRFYTNIIGLLDRHILESPFSLAEARILLEIYQMKECTATKLMEHLKLDKGYLSRILAKLAKENFIVKERSPLDNRSQFIGLTEKGRSAFLKLNESSDLQIQSMIDHLTDSEQQTLVNCMKKAQRILSSPFKPALSIQGIQIRHEIRPGDIGYLIFLHGRLYAKECGYNYQFEGYVAHTFDEFTAGYHPDKDRLWLAELDGQIVGSIAIIGHSKNEAQLRWLLIHPDVRKIGLGKTLLELALNFCRERHYRNIFLLTTSDQQTAIRMYTRAGFIKTSENAVVLWGKKLMDQRYELDMMIHEFISNK